MTSATQVTQRTAKRCRLTPASRPGKHWEKVVPETPPGGATVARSELLAGLARTLAVSGGLNLNLAWSDSELISVTVHPGRLHRPCEKKRLQ